jgi:hypothetical protein
MVISRPPLILSRSSSKIRPSVAGTPDTSTVLASFVLSSDNNPLIVSYEAVSTKLILEAGTYFAMFTSQGGNQGFVLANAESPFAYTTGTTTFGVLNPTSGTSSTNGAGSLRRFWCKLEKLALWH